MNQMRPPGSGSTARRRGSPGRRDAALDGARGLAAFAVVLSHIAAMSWIPFEDHVAAPHAWSYALWHLGAPAVDLFFVLSGYVVARSIAGRRGGYLPYLVGRYVRLLPIAWCGVLAGMLLRVLVVTIPPGMSAGMGHLLEPLSHHDMLGLLTMTWPVASTDRVDAQLWSMFIETQASILLPVAVLLARRSLAVYATSCLLALVGIILLSGSLYPVYFVGFAIGAAYAVHEDSVPAPPIPGAALAAGLAILLVRHWVGSDDEVYRIVGAVGALVVIVAIRSGAARAMLTGRICRWLGAVSYPLYAVHVPIMIGSCILLTRTIGVTASAIVAVPIALVVAEALRGAIDRPATILSRLVRA